MCLFDNLHTDAKLSSVQHKFSEIFSGSSTFISIGIATIVVKAVVLLLNLIQLAIAVTMSICPFDNLYIHILLETVALMLSILQVVAIEIVVGAIVTVVEELVIVKGVVVLVLVHTYCLLVKLIFPFKFSLRGLT